MMIPKNRDNSGTALLYIVGQVFVRRLFVGPTSTHHQRRFTIGDRRLVHAVLAGLCHSIEELNDTSLQGILATDHKEPVLLDQVLEDFRPVAQLIG